MRSASGGSASDPPTSSLRIAAPDPTLLAEGGASFWQKAVFRLTLGGGVLLLLLAPLLALAAAALGMGGLILGYLGFRLLLLWPPPGFRLVEAEPAAPAPPDALTPRIALLIALYDEARMAPRLLAALERLDYPRDRLEALILLEPEDQATAEAFAALNPPDWIRIVIAPPGSPRTKPRALNWGLRQARGEILGIFDAEDEPDPDQLRKAAAAFARAPPEVVCFQARLAWWNAQRNWITRGLALEYAAWFGFLLPALARRGWPIPLGGTSCYLRASALRELGGWDAHNVTEDAELGFRLARRGWRCDVLDSTTWEEAVIASPAWIRQRTRWIKGFLSTWISHMRDPARLWRETGASGFWTLNALTLGAFFAYLTLPLHAAFLLWFLATGEAPWEKFLPDWIGRLLSLLFWSGQIAALLISGFAAARIYGARAALWAPILPFYLTILGPLAALRAFRQLLAAPCFWEKTAHGLDPACAAPPPPDPQKPVGAPGFQDSRGAL